MLSLPHDAVFVANRFRVAMIRRQRAA